MIITPVYPNGSVISYVNTPDTTNVPFSRYRNLLRLTTINNQTFTQTWHLYGIPTSTEDQYHFVEPSEENRIDLISYAYYKVPQLWWVIALANSITDPLTLPIGTQLLIPSINTLYKFGGILA